jgi:DNA-binding transcriptional LysR family regulator
MKNLNLVHINGLRALEAVGRLGSLAAAAEELGVSSGAVSQHIIKAEEQLGQRVFDRRAKGLGQTDFGNIILPMLTDGFKRLSESVALAHRRDSDILTISVAPVFAARWLVSRIDSFIAAYPDIKLRIDATTNLVDPYATDVDLCIRVGAGKWPGMQAELLLEQTIFPVCSPALAASIRQPADLARLPAVIDGQSMFSWDQWLKAAGLEGATLSTRHVFNEASLCLDAVIAGQGTMLAWQTMAADAIANGCLVVPVPVRVKTGFGHYFVTPTGARPNAKVLAFKTWMRDALSKSVATLDRHFHEPAL